MTSLFALLALFLTAVPVIIPVRTQEEFDAFPAQLERLLPQADRIRVEFAPGTYYFRENHLDVRGWRHPGLEIILSGEQARFVAEGDSLAPALSFCPDDGWVDPEGDTDASLMGPVRSARFYPLPELFRPGRFRLRCDEPDLPEEDAANVYLVLTQWFQGALYKVIKISRGVAHLERVGEHSTKWYTEFRYGRCLPRYRMLNHPADRPAGPVHRCTVSTFCRVEDSRLGTLRVEGVRFLGNRSGAPLLSFRDTDVDSTVISGCSFEGIRGTAVELRNAAHVRFRNNTLIRCYRSCFSSDTLSVDSRVEGNTFHDIGLALTNAPAVLCKGPCFRIAGNLFEDFAYSAIGVGTHFMETDVPTASGVIEDNEISLSESFRRRPMRMLIDSGAIYVWTRNAGTVIRRNYVHDIAGHHGNRGIFCDDGVSGVRIEDNLVLGVDPSYCIDLRKCFRVERLPGSKVKRANVANRVTGNMVDGRCRLYVRKDDPESLVSGNCVLPSDMPREQALERWRKWTSR